MKKSAASNLLLIFIFLIGLSLLLYPTVSDYWNSFTQSRVVIQYAEQVANLDNDRYDAFLEEARQYNRDLLTKENRFRMTDEDREAYNALLNVSGNGIIGYIEIPVIKCSLPIYHGTEDSVLQIAIGHIDWTSLPIGGESTHSVLSGHRGLPSAKLFTDIDQMAVGDTFLIRVLDETLTYEVDKISIVEPHEVDSLAVEEGKDYCTLVTCTPYGINTHRLLVRGRRIENQPEAKVIRITADAMLIEPMVVAPIVAAPMLLVLLILLLLPKPKRRP